MNETDVTREGLKNVRPGREARMWSGPGPAVGGAVPDAVPKRRRRDAAEAFGSYYGQPIINAPVWEEREIAGYLFTGGLAGASSLLAAGSVLSGRPALARRCAICASGALGISFVALIRDLGRPERFVNMLRVFKPSSPMSVGTWILSAYAPFNFAAGASAATGLYPGVGAAAAVGAAGLAPLVATYTAALISDTAVPAWHGGHRQLPFLFAGSAASAAAGFGLVAGPMREAAPARRMAVLGVALELGAGRVMERELGVVAETLHDGAAGCRLRLAKVLTAAGALGAATAGRRNRIAAAGSGAALLAGSALTRFGLFAAGMASARDPKYTVVPQRERADAAGT